MAPERRDRGRVCKPALAADLYHRVRPRLAHTPGCRHEQRRGNADPFRVRRRRDRALDLERRPATNLLPIRRLDLAVGERADVRTAWLRFPELRVAALAQSYSREAERVFHYEALVDGERFQARLDTDEFGCVLRYEGLWEAEPATAILHR
jgi:hypothetical protein